MKYFDIELSWLGHAGFRIITNNHVHYIDPFQLKKPKVKAHVILFTHPHYDHFDLESIEKIMDEKTMFIGPVQCCSEVEARFSKQAFSLSPGGEIQCSCGAKVYAVRAYNNKEERLKYHPKSNNWLGYIFEFNGKRIYHAGDTDFIEEMKNIKCDIALLPIGGTYTMDALEAAEAAKAIKPKVAIPMHYKMFSKNWKKSEEDFKKALEGSGIKVEILKEED
ncbi:MAG: MBL fold metallo-hydrolase [Candidatus Micrarchaeia archaeon]|jgi:L-ascorbate metabolism protein UlaG (beta-lactamase superfamily)